MRTIMMMTIIMLMLTMMMKGMMMFTNKVVLIWMRSIQGPVKAVIAPD